MKKEMEWNRKERKIGERTRFSREDGRRKEKEEKSSPPGPNMMMMMESSRPL